MGFYKTRYNKYGFGTSSKSDIAMWFVWAIPIAGFFIWLGTR